MVDQYLGRMCPGHLIAKTLRMITVENLTKHYGGFAAVDDISFVAEPGKVTGFLGPNGAGKSTTMRMMVGLTPPTSGTTTVLGVPYGALNNPGVQVGVLLDASAQHAGRTGREVLTLGAEVMGLPRQRVDEMLELVALTDRADARTENLSGGQKQRLSIACSLVHDPELVFLDEPSSGLDPQARRNLWDLLRSINEDGRTVVLTTHFMDEAERLCDRVAIIDHGRILATDTPAGFVRGLDAPTHISVAPGVVTEPDAAALPGVESVGNEGESLTLSTRQPARVLTALAERDALDGLAVRGATLEDVFLELTGREYRA